MTTAAGAGMAAGPDLATAEAEPAQLTLTRPVLIVGAGPTANRRLGHRPGVYGLDAPRQAR
jgi:hypothetical protein